LERGNYYIREASLLFNSLLLLRLSLHPEGDYPARKEINEKGKKKG